MEYEIQRRAEIGFEPPKGTTPWRGSVEGIIAHWVGGWVQPDISQVSAKSLLRALQQSAFREGYQDIEYNFAYDGSGRIYELRGWDVESGANGAGTNYNRVAIAVVYLGGRRTVDGRLEDTPYTPEARAAFLWLCQEAARRFPIVSYVWPHSKVRIGGTDCPGPEITDYLPFVTDHLRDVPEPVPPPPDPGDEDVRGFFAKHADSATVWFVYPGGRTRLRAMDDRAGFLLAGFVHDVKIFTVAKAWLTNFPVQDAP
jgi:hypothetical protein